MNSEMNPARESISTLYPSGNCVLVENPRRMIIKFKPYAVYPLNKDGYRVLQALGNGSSRSEIQHRLGIKTEGALQKLDTFLAMVLDKDVITKDKGGAGELKIKASRLTPPLERIFLEVTKRCNLKCAHCYLSASSRVSDEDELGYGDIIGIIERANELGVYRFDFTGGEIFFHDRINDFLQAALEEFMIVNIFTNGTLLNGKRCEFIGNLGNVRTAFVSLDDVREDVHDRFRGMKGAFRNTVEGIGLLKQNGIRVVVNITIWKQNVKRTLEIIDFCREGLGVECRIAPIVYVGRGKCFENDDVTVEDVVGAMKKVIGSREQLVLGYCGEAEWMNRNIPGCGVGHRMLYIKSDGEMCLCPTLSSHESPDFELGRIGTDDIGDVWEGSETLRHFRNTYCKNQDCKYLSICRGGCRSRAFLESRDLFAPDSLTCAYFGV